MMLSIATFVLIYLGVCIAIYQLYDIYCAQSFGDARRLSGIEDEALRDLSRQARQYARTGESAGFAASVAALFGKDLDPRVVLAAFSEARQTSTPRRCCAAGTTSSATARSASATCPSGKPSRPARACAALSWS